MPDILTAIPSAINFYASFMLSLALNNLVIIFCLSKTAKILSVYRYMTLALAVVDFLLSLSLVFTQPIITNVNSTFIAQMIGPIETLHSYPLCMLTFACVWSAFTSMILCLIIMFQYRLYIFHMSASKIKSRFSPQKIVVFYLLVASIGAALQSIGLTIVFVPHHRIAKDKPNLLITSGLSHLSSCLMVVDPQLQPGALVYFVLNGCILIVAYGMTICYGCRIYKTLKRQNAMSSQTARLQKRLITAIFIQVSIFSISMHARFLANACRKKLARKLCLGCQVLETLTNHKFDCKYVSVCTFASANVYAGVSAIAYSTANIDDCLHGRRWLWCWINEHDLADWAIGAIDLRSDSVESSDGCLCDAMVCETVQTSHISILCPNRTTRCSGHHCACHNWPIVHDNNNEKKDSHCKYFDNTWWLSYKASPVMTNLQRQHEFVEFFVCAIVHAQGQETLRFAFYKKINRIVNVLCSLIIAWVLIAPSAEATAIWCKRSQVS